MSTDLIDVHAPAIDIQGLVKHYGDNEVLKGIDLTVVAGASRPCRRGRRRLRGLSACRR